MCQQHPIYGSYLPLAGLERPQHVITIAFSLLVEYAMSGDFINPPCSDVPIPRPDSAASIQAALLIFSDWLYL